jgi:4-hydroxy-4-methyl-2-oxoglutarate aldolase
MAAVGVMPGQYVFADDSGALVVPDVQIEEVLESARRIKVEDERFRREIASETSPMNQKE